MKQTNKYWPLAPLTAVVIWAGCAATSRYQVETQEPGPEEPEVEEEEVTEEPIEVSGAGEQGPTWTFAVEPKPLGDTVQRGLGWLVGHQLEDGGWGQGDEAHGMGNAMSGLVSKSNVADTCMGALALIRSGSTPAEGVYSESLLAAIDYVCGKIEQFEDDPSLTITDVMGTRVQSKIGTYIDTFLASMVLSEVQDQMPDREGNERVKAALATVLDKIERNQASDGTFDNQGWAPVLAQSMAGKALGRGYQLGFDVDLGALERVDDFAVGDTPAPGSAGVSLYSSAAGLGAIQEVSNTNAQREGDLRDQEVNAPTEEERVYARNELKKIEDFREVGRKAKDDVIQRLNDPSFLAGFGSNGGEEFLSYMNISESLVVDADETWRKWDAWVGANLNRVQNQDGSWTGHHCITGRTFCTAAALLTLMADRTPVPVEMVAVAE